MSNDPIQTAARNAARIRKLGPHASCTFCAIGDPVVLVTAGRTLLESHHVVGEANESKLATPLCRNHHATAHEKLLDAGADMKPPSSLLDKLVAVLRSIGVFLRDLGEHCIQWANQLASFITALDVTAPAWRTMQEARP